MCKVFAWLTVAVPAGVYYRIVALAVDRVVAILAPIWNKLTTARRMSLMNTVEFSFRVMDTQRNKCAYSKNPVPVYFSVYVTSILFLFPLLALFVRALKKRSSGRATTPNMDAAANTREAQRRMMIVTTCAFILLLPLDHFHQLSQRRVKPTKIFQNEDRTGFGHLQFIRYW